MIASMCKQCKITHITFLIEYVLHYKIILSLQIQLCTPTKKTNASLNTYLVQDWRPFCCYKTFRQFLRPFYILSLKLVCNN